MNIILGYWLDSAKYPDAMGDKEASLGTVVTGFHGLAGLLETQLGLSMSQVSQNLRIAQWQELLGKWDDGNQLYSKSFETDSWNTAKELLRRRDELVLAGWDPAVHKGGSPWLETLAELELANTEKIWGFPDRIRALMKKLQEENVNLQIEKITIVDPNEHLWDPWAQELLRLLQRHGIQIEKEPVVNEPPSAETDTDLALLQAVLAGKASPAPAKGDGSLLLVRSGQEWDAADFLSHWLRENGTGQTVLIKNEGSVMLDEILHRYGVAAPGVDTPSKWRAVLQVLPLVIDTYWEPLRVERLMELLTLPVSPLPGTIRFKLAQALAEEPGVGGRRWNEALELGIKELETDWELEGLDEKERKKRRKDLDATLELWVNHEYYNPNKGIPLEKITHLCQKVSQWAAGMYHMTDEPIFAEAVRFAGDVMAGLKSLGAKHITRLQASRIIESVLGEGAKLSGYEQEAAKWEVVDHPGQIWGRADAILWWGFHRDESGAQIRTWTAGEREWLRKNGIYLTEDAVRRRREAASWRQAVIAAKKKLVLIAPEKVRGEDVPVHPLWDEIRFAVAADRTAERNITWDAALLKREAAPLVGGKPWERHPVNVRKLPEPLRTWKVPENAISPREEESATSFESLVGCPLQWTFKYGAKLYPGSALSLPHDAIMLGNLGHAILERLIMEKGDWSEEEAGFRTGELFEEMTPMLAAPLLEPKNKVKLSQTKRSMQKAIGQFFKVLNEAGISIRHTEYEMEKNWNDKVKFKGRMDLVGETPSGRTILFDAKWSSRPAHYKKRIEEGSVQLSLYHWLLADEGEGRLPVAYFILSSGDFFSTADGEFPEDYHVEGPDLAVFYETVRRAVEDVWSQLLAGTVSATGIPKPPASEAEGEDAEEHAPSYEPIIEPPGMFCDYKNLCGLERVEKQ